MRIALLCGISFLLFGAPELAFAEDRAPSLEIRARHIGETEEKTLIVEEIEIEGKELRSDSGSEAEEAESEEPAMRVEKEVPAAESTSETLPSERAALRATTEVDDTIEMPGPEGVRQGTEQSSRGPLTAGIALLIALAGGLAVWRMRRREGQV